MRRSNAIRPESRPTWSGAGRFVRRRHRATACQPLPHDDPVHDPDECVRHRKTLDDIQLSALVMEQHASPSLLALTRAVPSSIVHCELTHVARQPIDFARAAQQHDRYELALAVHGYTVQRLPHEDALPDSV